MNQNLVEIANSLVDLNDKIHSKAEEIFCGGEAGIDEFDSCEKAIDFYSDLIKAFEDRWKVKVVWDNNYTFNLYIISDEKGEPICQILILGE